MSVFIGKCPVCDFEYYRSDAKLDHGAEAIECWNCGWKGTTDDLIFDEEAV